jgi:hypothetical protein
MIPTGAEFDLVHVGKCAGGTVASALRQAGYSFQHVHMRRLAEAAGVPMSVDYRP